RCRGTGARRPAGARRRRPRPCPMEGSEPMTHELFYTSAPQGVKPGSHGFCTVALTGGLQAVLADRLEALSASRPAFPPHDERASRSPVVRAHYQLTQGGRALHVLSWVSA